MGVQIAHVTLHVGLGTFRPVKVDDVEKHHMHSEFYIVEEDQAKLINDTKKNGGRVIAVGTQAVVLESATGEDGNRKSNQAAGTEIFSPIRSISQVYRCPESPNFHLTGVYTADAGVRTGRKRKNHACI